MLRLTTDQPDFWVYLLPEEARRMHPELRVVDAVLDDQRFLEPFRGRFSARRGRYTIPMETYLRMMYLKTKYQLGYESLVEEVTDSVSWRRFCRISLSGRVPDASTLIKLTNGPCQGLADEVHDALVRELANWSGSWLRRRFCGAGRCGWTPRWWKPTFTIPPMRTFWQTGYEW